MEKEITRNILKKVRQIEIRTNRLVNDSLAGNYHSVFKGRGMNFDEVREYVPGDDIRSIDWNVTARTGVAHIKKFSEERELTIMLMIDISKSGDFGSGESSKREMIAELASVLAFSAIKNNDKVGLILFTDEIELYIPAKKGRSHILRVIQEILFFKAKGVRTNLQTPLNFINSVCKKKCVVFLLSDFSLTSTDDISTLQPSLKIANKYHDLIAILISDPNERQLPNLGWICLEDAETGEQIEIDSSNPRVREEYNNLILARLRSIQQSIRSSGIDLLDLLTNEPYLPKLLHFFGMRRERRSR
ncbi:DUF58 domain-containing protein [Desulfotalea psychrophila]|nr:DUF58 domain-containing protein [Desulfotalea psychrophila]